MHNIDFNNVKTLSLYTILNINSLDYVFLMVSLNKLNSLDLFSEAIFKEIIIDVKLF